MFKFARLGSLALVLALGLGMTAFGAGCSAGDASSDEVGTGEDMFTVDIPKSEELLAKAVQLAERHDGGQACEEEVYLTDIVDNLRKAIAVRDTVWFRTRVIAAKPILVKVLGGSLEWQEILGTFKPNRLSTLPGALNAGVSLWDTSGGVFGNKGRLEFQANGKAVVHTLDIENMQNIHWNSAPTTWSFQNNQIKLGNGETYDVTFEDGMLKATLPGGGIAYISQKSECEA
jgi:hypothetical protein